MTHLLPLLTALPCAAAPMQVPGAGVQGVCRIGNARPVYVMFGGADWINSHISDSALTSSLNTLLQQHHGRPSRATAVLSIAQLLPPGAADSSIQLQHQQALHPADDAAVLMGGSGISSSSGRPHSPCRLKSSHGNNDGSTTYSFEEESAQDDPQYIAAAAAVQAASASTHWDLASASSTGTEAAAQGLSSSSSSSSSLGSARTSSSGFTVDSELARQEQQQQQELRAYGSPGQPSQLVLLCFEDVIQAGVPTAVQQLQSGSWSAIGGGGGSSSSWWGRSSADAAKDVVMLTGVCVCVVCGGGC